MTQGTETDRATGLNDNLDLEAAQWVEHLIKQSRNVSRPGDDVVAEIKKLDVAVLFDGMRRTNPYAACQNIKAVLPFMRGRVFAGPAITIEWRPTLPEYVATQDPRAAWGKTREDHTFAAIDLCRPGDVIVSAGLGHDLAFVGELLATFSKKRGIEAWVIDGMGLDYADIDEIGMAVFARGSSVRSEIMYLETTNLNVPVQCDGVLVNPGDMIVGDDDGVLVIPMSLIPHALSGAYEKRKWEQQRLADATAGKPFLGGELGRLIERYRNEGRI